MLRKEPVVNIGDEFSKLQEEFTELVGVKLKIRTGKKYCCYKTETKTITLSFHKNRISVCTLFVLLHECRHAIQHKKDMFGSKSPEIFGKMEKDADDWALKQFRIRYEHLFDTEKNLEFHSRHVVMQKEIYGSHYKE